MRPARVLPGAAARFCFKLVELDGKFKLSAELARDHVPRELRPKDCVRQRKTQRRWIRPYPIHCRSVWLTNHLDRPKLKLSRNEVSVHTALIFVCKSPICIMINSAHARPS